MTATYSSFDTLSIGACDATPGMPDGSLPVLAEIPKLTGRSQRPMPAKPSPQEPVATHDEPPTAAPSTLPIAEPAPTPPEAREPVEKLPRLAADEWSEEHWSARVLDFESTLRPHARLIALVTLIVMTGVTLAVMRAPVEVAVEAPPTDVVDAPHTTPGVLEEPSADQLVNTAPLWSPPADEAGLEPIPALPPRDTPASARVTAVGPVSSASRGAYLDEQSVTPVEPYRQAANDSDSDGTSVSGPTESRSAVRTAARPAYPTTPAPTQSWPSTRQSTSGDAPVAELLPTIRSY